LLQPAAWVALVCAVFFLFSVFDWDHGVIRAGLLLALAALAWWRRRTREPSAAPSAAWTRAAVGIVSLALIVHVALSASWIVRSLQTGTVPSDQAETVMASLDAARAGRNPWASDTNTDRVAHGLAVDDLRSKPDCGAVPAAAAAPAISPAAGCAHTRVLFASLGFKYGPAMLAFYAPFLAAFGPAGFPISHLLLFLFTVWALAAWARAQRGAACWTALAIAPFVLTRHVATNILDQGHLDLLPTLLCLMGVIAAGRRQYAMAACAIGASIAGKLLPGLAFVPLLFAGPLWSAALALAIPLVCLAPFAINDWTGLWHNIGYPFTRDPDSTALMFSLAGPLVWIVRLAALGVIGWLLLRAQRRRWGRGETLDWIVGAQLAILAAGATLHNNYMVWLLPYFGALAIATNER
jgi:Glycosyltransferase family 87